MTGVLMPTGVVTVCCGGHRPAAGCASSCLCCAECTTNVEVQRLACDVRAAHARLAREQAVRWRAAVESCQRWAFRILVHEVVERRVHQLEVATRHAVPTWPECPAQRLPEELSSRWFTEVAS